MSITFNLARDVAELRSLVKDSEKEYQGILYPNTCDIWIPDTLVIDSSARTITNDTQRFVLLVQGQRCYHQVEPILSEESRIGATQTVSIFTMDKLYFPEDTNIKDRYAVVFMTPGNNFRGVWKIQGNARASNFDPMRPITDQRVFAVRDGDVPLGITNIPRYGF